MQKVSRAQSLVERLERCLEYIAPDGSLRSLSRGDSDDPSATDPYKDFSTYKSKDYRRSGDIDHSIPNNLVPPPGSPGSSEGWMDGMRTQHNDIQDLRRQHQTPMGTQVQ